MGRFFFRLVYPLARTLRVPQLLRRMLEEDRKDICRARVTLKGNARFGASAVVHNHPDRAERIFLAEGVLVDGELLVHDYGGRIEIGRNTYVGQGSRVWSGESVKIGRDVFIAHNVNITDTNSHQMSARERAEHFERTHNQGLPFEKGTVETTPVVIGDHAWINFNVGILKGVKIGEGAIVGACSLVTKDVAPYTFVAGNPLRVIRELPREGRT